MRNSCILVTMALVLILSLWGGAALADTADNDEAVATALSYFEKNKATYKINNPAEELKVKVVGTDRMGNQHVRINQYYEGIRVIGGQLIAHLSPDGVVKRASGRFIADLNLPVTSSISEEKAAELAASHLTAGVERANAFEQELVIFPWQGDSFLCWRVYLHSALMAGDWEYFIDASSGEVIYYASRNKTGDTIGTGYGVMGNYHFDIRTYYDEFLLKYYLEDYTRLPFGEVIETYLGNSSLPGIIASDLDNYWDDSLPQNAAVDAHVYGGLLYDWMWSHLGRDSYDGWGASMTTTVNSVLATERIMRNGFRL